MNVGNKLACYRFVFFVVLKEDRCIPDIKGCSATLFLLKIIFYFDCIEKVKVIFT